MFCEVSRVIPATPQALWNVLADLSRLKEWIPQAADLALPAVTQAAVGVEIEIKQQTRMGCIEITLHIDHCDATTLLAWRHSRELLNGNPITEIKDFSTTLSLTSLGDNQTRLTARSIWSSVGAAGIMAGAMLKPKLQREYAAALERLEKLATPV